MPFDCYPERRACLVSPTGSDVTSSFRFSAAPLSCLLLAEVAVTWLGTAGSTQMRGLAQFPVSARDLPDWGKSQALQTPTYLCFVPLMSKSAFPWGFFIFSCPKLFCKGGLSFPVWLSWNLFARCLIISSGPALSYYIKRWRTLYTQKKKKNPQHMED